MGVGSAATAAGFTLPECATAPALAGIRVLSSLMRRLVKIAPSAAVPSDPPIERKSVAPAVATPRSSYGASFWTARIKTCMTMPRPKPSTTMYAAAASVEVCGPICASSAKPSTVIPVPAIG